MNYLDNAYIREEVDEVIADYARLNNLDSGIIIEHASGGQHLTCLINYEDLSNPEAGREVFMTFEIEWKVCEQMRYSIHSDGLRDECEDFEYESPRLVSVEEVA